MDYTQNYHLPQWEKNDRVLMEDFNGAMASLDAGVKAAQTAAEATAGQISQVDRDARSRDSANAASAAAALKTGLFRAAYNHYHAVTERDPLPRQSGLFFQKLLPSCAAQTGFSGFLARNDGAIWTAKAANIFTHKNLIQEVTLVQKMSIVKNGVRHPLIVDIDAPGPGFFTLVTFAGYGRNVDSASVTWHVTWTNLDTQDVEQDFRCQIKMDTSSANDNTFKSLPSTLYFHQARYRLTIDPVDTNYNAEYYLHGDYSFYATTIDSGTASIQKTLELEEAGSDGLLSLAYWEYGPGGTIKLTWDGKVISPHATYAYTDNEGRRIKELVFRKGSSVSTNSSVRLDFQCQTGHAMTLYRWGVILI